MSGDDSTFRFESPGISLELEGPEAFVEAQLARMIDRVRAEIAAAAARARDGVAQLPPRAAAAPAPAPAPDAPPAAEDAPPEDPAEERPPTLAEFHKRARSREGRGAIQETILIFAYYLTAIRGQPAVSISDIAGCFADTGVSAPGNLANTMGMMRRKQGFFEAGEGRGQYVLTSDGAAYVRRLIGA